MATKTKKITQQELINKVKDLNVSDEDLAKYFTLDPRSSIGFTPTIIARPELLQETELEAAFVLSTFNLLSRYRRNLKYRIRIRDWTGVRVVAEGDSWFQYPLILKDTIDHLCDLKQFKYAIYGLSEASDLLSTIIKEDEISAAIENESPDVFLISGGGNDMVGNGRIATMVERYSANRQAENYPNHKFDSFLLELKNLYHGLFTRLLTSYPHLKIICHGYDYVIPNNGPWLGKPLASVGIKNKTLQHKIVSEMINQFNDVLIELASEFKGSVYNVDCRGTVGSLSKWHDELHPKNAGFLKVSKKIDATIKQALSEHEMPGEFEAGLFDGRTSQHHNRFSVRKVSKLDDKIYNELVAKRAQVIMNKSVELPKNRSERKDIEKQITKHYEKVYKEANFLPSSFLEKGVNCAQAVCRIATNQMYGSGFLIANRHFIMTNSHVIPDQATARMSKALFDYDEDDIEYTVRLRPEQFFITNKELDFTIVACDSSALPGSINAIPLLRDQDTIIRDERVNIIQHPDGRRKELALHHNQVKYVYDSVIRYITDTEPGSSGSPVFNNQWNLVALHHAGWYEPDGTTKPKGDAINEGIRIAAIVDYLVSQRTNEDANSKSFEYLLDCVSSCGEASINALAKLPAAGMHTSLTSDFINDNHAEKSLTLNIQGKVSEVTIKMD